MTYEEAARILDPETSREAFLPYAYDPQYQQMLLRKACVIAANVLEDYAALTVSCPEGDLIMPGGETFEAKFLSLPRVSYEPLRPVDVMPVNCIKIQYHGEKKFPTIEEFAREAKDQAIKIIEEETGVSFDRLVQLACADQEGRCTIFPCRDWLDLVFGEQEVFYGIDMDYMENPIREITVRSDERITWYGDYTTIVLRGRDENGYEREFLPEEVGKTVFRTREEAEFALKAMKESEEK